MSNIKSRLKASFWFLILFVAASVIIPLVTTQPVNAQASPGCYSEVQLPLDPDISEEQRARSEGSKKVPCSDEQKDNVDKFDICYIINGQAATPADCNGIDLSIDAQSAAGYETTCAREAGQFSFLLCDVIDWGSSVISLIDDEVREALEVEERFYENDSIKKAWSRFRNIAYILLIPIMLIMVIGTALQFSFVDAYTVKRAMPRLLAAVIFMALSYDICIILIDVTNNVGRGVAGLVAAPFGGPEALTLSEVFGGGAGSAGALGVGVVAGIAIGGLAKAAFGILASFLFVAALAILIIFALLTIRELVIVFLIILSPLAILAWIFPGNDALWKLWWNAFSKLLMVYPLIIGLLVSGRAFASIAGDGGEGGIEAMFIVLVKLVTYIGPFFFIPVVFKAAGGAVGSLLGQINDRGKGIFDRQRQYRSGRYKQKGADLKSGNFFRGADADGATRTGRMNTRLQKLAAGLDAAGKGDFTQSGRKAALERFNIDEKKHAAEDATLQTKLKNDDFAAILALDTQEERLKYLADKGYTEDAAKTNAAAAAALITQHGAHGIRQMAVDAKAASKTSYTGGIDEMLDDIMKMSHGDENLAMTMLGSASAAAMSAGRFDLGGGSYGEKAGMLKAMMRKTDVDFTNEMTGESGVIRGSITRAEINQRQAAKALDGISAFQAGQMHPTAAKNIAEAMGADFETAFNNVAINRQQANPIMSKAVEDRTTEEKRTLVRLDAEYADLQKVIGQKTAHAATLEQAFSQMPPEVARILSTGISAALPNTLAPEGLTNRDGQPIELNNPGDVINLISNIKEKERANQQATFEYNQQLQSYRQRRSNALSRGISNFSEREPEAPSLLEITDLERNMLEGFDSLTKTPYSNLSPAERAQLEQNNQNQES